ncbi:asparagine synthetase B family protein [Dyella monticola]|uniref:asparagine synthase (glutamine-hydrolyzing) n=1 Tax=Dyella monticola TaxID=1927958 RepID=A0A370X9X0_9GAMM|nr:asparagine synthetase B family protein [Dyella monticola]RDS85061.1 asparagine synthetase B family protein [Dyella monticola]
MFRFIAFAWDAADQEQATGAHRLSRQVRDQYGSGSYILNCDGLVVHWVDARERSSEHYLLADHRGVVLGKLFKRESGGDFQSPECRLNAAATQSILANGGRGIITNYWGRYVAFLRDSSGNVVQVIRDPTGSLPCFMTTIAGIRVFFSYIHDCVRLGAQFTVNWDYVRVQLAANVNERLNGTGLNEVVPIHCGECVKLGPHGLQRQFYWNPFDVAGTQRCTDPMQASAELRQVVRTCVHAWASCYDTILHRLSGGIDSSIIAMCLASAPTRPQVTCFTHFSPGPDSDEREYARLVARRAGFELVEHPRRIETCLDLLAELVPHPHPFHARYAIDYSRYESHLARERSATAILSGEWGDPLFYSEPAHMLAAIDCAQQKGIGRALIRASLDTARIEGLSMWRVLRHAIAARSDTPAAFDPRQQLPAGHGCLTEETALAAARDDRFVHPWLRTAARTTPGKMAQVYASTMVDFHPFYDPLGREDDPEQFAPLNSQPIVELCLRIPTFVLIDGGWDRAVARRAFLNDLPLQVATRRTKGGVEEYQKASLTHNAALARAYLLDGALASRGLLNRTALEEMLSGEPTRTRTPVGLLYWYLCTEAWLSQWDHA